MPGSYRFYGEILVMTFEGETSVAQVEELVTTALLDPMCPVRPNVLSDLRASTSIAARPWSELQAAVGIFGGRRSQLGARYALLTESGVQFGVMRMAEALAEYVGMETMVFTDEPSAIAWLGDS